MVHAENLVKKYGKKTALDGVSLHIGAGETVGLLGPNGAGKTTVMNILTGCISYTSGSVKIAGEDILENPSAAKRRIGYLPETPPLYPDMTVREFLNFVYDLKRASMPDKAAHIAEKSALAGISDILPRRIGNLSKGYRQRVGIAAAIIGDPDILILDEPTNGLDPQQIAEIRALIKKIGDTKTVIISSHIMSEIRAVCTCVVIIHNGKIVAEDTPEALEQLSSEHKRVYVSVISDAEAAEILASAAGVEHVKFEGTDKYGAKRFSVTVSDVVDETIFANINRAAQEHNMVITSISEPVATLEEAFLQLTAEEEAEQ